MSAKYLPVNSYWKQLTSTKKSTLQASHWYRGPNSWYRSIELDKLNIFCSICLYKIFTRKKLLISTFLDIKSTRQASHGAHGPISWYRSKELDKLNNFCSICLFKIFKIKKLWCKTFLKIRRHGGFNFRVTARFDVFQPRSMKLLTWA